MKIFKVGDTQKAACNQCKSFKDVTFKLRNVPFNDKSGIVKNVLVGVCNCCDSVAVLPHQSTPAVKNQLDIQRKALESRVPAHMIDILNLASYELGAGADFSQSLMKYYIHVLSNGEMSSKSITKFLDTDLAKGESQKRISIKGRYIVEELERLKVITDIKQTTDLIKIIVLKINDDLLVKKKPLVTKQLKSIASATY
ncbi:MAG: hypothetical protein KUG76_08340 [Gammaproteobacteria bacterium]|nr:hypothetical protein [Gammaproteobacteria bacterium]